MKRILRVIASSTRALIQTIFAHRRIIWTTTRVELSKKYSGAVLGIIWVFLYPAMLLSIYLFVYMVVFKMKFPGYSQMHYVLYVFSGLVPYIGLMEAVSSGTTSVKDNIHIIKNVMLPIELVPLRTVVTSMVSQLVSIGILIVLVMISEGLTFHVLWLPLVIVLQFMFLVGLVWMFSAIAVTLPDISYFTNLFLLLLLFISPIGFKPEMVPSHLQMMVLLNPVYYMADMFRSSLLYAQFPSLTTASVYIVMCLGSFMIGGTFFHKFKSALVDYE